jgi:hypothetical protein
MVFRSVSMLLAGVALVALAVPGWAEPKLAAPKTVAGDLDNPSGVAVHAGTGHVFLAAHTGVYRLAPGTPGKLTAEVTGFKTDLYGKGPKYNIGPLGVALLGDKHLIVGDGSLVDGEELVRVFKIAPTPPAQPAAAESAEFLLGPIKAGAESAKGEGNFYAIAVSSKAFYVTANGDDTKGWVLKSDITDGKPGELKPFLPTKPAVSVDAPVGITLSADEKTLVVGQMGEVNVPGDSLLTMYETATGKLVKSLKTGLHDIAGLAYSPKTGKLYCVDFAWVDTKQGGLYELTVTGDEVKATKIASLDKPTALAFDKDGGLYVTVFGTAAAGSTTPSGALLYFAAGL